MSLDLERIYVASYDTKGGFWTEPAKEYLKRTAESCIAGQPPTRFAIAICEGMIPALRCVKAARAARKERLEKGQTKQEAGGSTFTGGPAAYPEPRSAAEVIR
jgi:hypothetical protein